MNAMVMLAVKAHEASRKSRAMTGADDDYYYHPENGRGNRVWKDKGEEQCQGGKRGLLL